MKRKIVCMAVAAILASQLTVGAYYTNDLSFPLQSSDSAEVNR